MSIIFKFLYVASASGGAATVPAEVVNKLDLLVIIGAAGGGAFVAALICLFGVCCVCIMCCCNRSKRNKTGTVQYKRLNYAV